MEFFHFISLSRKSFQELVEVCGPITYEIPLWNGSKGKPKRNHIKLRKFSPADMIAMAMKDLLSKAESKDIYAQFGAIPSTYANCVQVGKMAIIKGLLYNRGTSLRMG